MTNPIWNQAAWKANTYKPSTRKVFGPVGDDSLNRGGVDTVCCKRCGYYVHDASCEGHPDHAPQKTVEHPKGWEAAETGVAQDAQPSLTIQQVAELPIGTRVTVDCGDEAIPSGMVFTVRDHAPANLPGQALLREHNGAEHCDWCISFDCAGQLTFKVTAEAKPTLLTLPEAAEACRAGKTVKCVAGCLEGMLFMTDGLWDSYWMQTDDHKATWRAADFPYYDYDTSGLRFEVVA